MTPSASSPTGCPQSTGRVEEEDFGEISLSQASNNSPRGIWSDGGVMYVADVSDGRVYSYNMPDAIDARLASLTLSSIDIGEFSPITSEYHAVAPAGVTVTTVDPHAEQAGTRPDITPPDVDTRRSGHQVAVAEGAGVTVTVTSTDGSRERVYRVAIEPAPVASCLRGAVDVGVSLLTYEGGSVDELTTCAEDRHIEALYACGASARGRRPPRPYWARADAHRAVRPHLHRTREEALERRAP